MDLHSFHIPVLGTAFSIDTPIRVARFGISSVISLADDFLIEDMRKVYSEKHSLPYEKIGNRDEDARARRITGYLNIVNSIVGQQIEKLKSEPFVPGSEITKYFELVPEGPAKAQYAAMLLTTGDERKTHENALRGLVKAGRIDVNIMTKLDRDRYKGKEKCAPEFSDALSGLRGFAKSDLSNSCVIFSAGMNPRLYGYATEFDDFYPDSKGVIKKGIILKVSDYRSTATQGKFLAKRGLWVQEYRIESGLNCGGHAFATEGLLVGPILQEFKDNREELQPKLLGIWKKGIAKQNRDTASLEPSFRITYQGGIGSGEEDAFLRTYYNIEGTGWGTPFMLVPEAVCIDDEHLQKLITAGTEDVHLSKASPLGVPFWLLKASSSEAQREEHIAQQKPGSACPQGILAFNTEFTEIPLCTASKRYQKLKLEQLENADITVEKKTELIDDILRKSCICKDLGGSAKVLNGLVEKAAITVCSGPNIVNFNKMSTLQEMVDHIYARATSLVSPDKKHVFLNELQLYIDYYKSELNRVALGVLEKKESYFVDFQSNMLSGIDYYKNTAENFLEDTKKSFLQTLADMRLEVENLVSV